MKRLAKAALFDMDGLMYDTERISTDAWFVTAKEMRFELTREQCDAFRGTNKESKRPMFAEWYNGKVDYDQAFALHKNHMEEYLSRNGVPVKKGLYVLLDALKEKGYKIAVATSTQRKFAAEYWKQTKIDGYMDANICGDEVIKSKPDPEIFIKAAEKLGIPVEQCLIFEDSFNGIRAANAAGGIVVMVPDLLMPTDEIRSKCDYIFEDLGQAVEIL